MPSHLREHVPNLRKHVPGDLRKHVRYLQSDPVRRLPDRASRVSAPNGQAEYLPAALPGAVTVTGSLSGESLDPRPHVWRPLLTGPQLRQARSVAIDVAERLADRRIVRDAVASAAARTQFPRALHWAPYGVAQGEAGLAILHGYLDS
ncbi:MAG TPA: hypothetical protein VFD73_07705, partial [Gemmatimonadales bacterium]|nr:hypothetical protein [Gemmatimonadales bacterium]